MKALSVINEQIFGFINPTLDQIKKRIFGANNERLDFIMDSFHKLSPEHQKGAIAGVLGAVALVLFMAFGIYFSRISALEADLNQAFEALQELRTLSAEYKTEQDNYDNLEKSVARKTSDLRPKPFFEQKSNALGIKLENLRSEESDFAPDNPMGKSFRSLSVEFRASKVSIPKLLTFLSEIERADKTLNVNSLQIRARYGDRLYFDAMVKVNGYLPLSGAGR